MEDGECFFTFYYPVSIVVFFADSSVSLKNKLSVLCEGLNWTVRNLIPFRHHFSIKKKTLQRSTIKSKKCTASR